MHHVKHAHMYTRDVMIWGEQKKDIDSNILFQCSHMGISVMEDERGHIQKVVESFKQTFTELGYIKA